MRLYLGGSEVSDHRHHLTEWGVTDVSLSYAKLAARVKFARPWLLEDHYAPEQHIFLDSGAYSFNREGSELTEDDAMELATGYMAFVVQNVDRAQLVSEFDALSLGPDWLAAMREDFYDELPQDKFLPIWHDETGYDELEALASRYERVGIFAKDINDKMLPQLRDLVNRHGTKLHGVSMTKMDVMRWDVWDSVGSTSWLSPSKYGETHIWLPNNELKWYPNKYKAQCRSRHRSWIEQNGFDAQAILDDDPKEVLRLSVWSWQQYVAALNSRVSNPTGNTDSGNGELLPGAVGDPAGNTVNVPAVREPRGEVLIPVIGIHQADDEEGEEPLLGVQDASLMQCDNCYVRDLCPEVKAGASCAYKIPVQVTSKRQMRALQDTLISMQTQRVMMMRMIEQFKGGYADANTSSEMDRLQRMIKHKWESEKAGFRLTIEADGTAKDGILSNLLGSDVGDEVTALEEPRNADDAMRDMDIVEADVIGGD